MEAELIHTEKQTERHDKGNKCFLHIGRCAQKHLTCLCYKYSLLEHINVETFKPLEHPQPFTTKLSLGNSDTRNIQKKNSYCY